MDDVIHMQLDDVRDLSFGGSGLVGDYIPAGKADVIYQWTNGDRRALMNGRTGSLSPDGRWLLFIQKDHWVLRDMKRGSERVFNDGAPTDLITSPVWSANSRFVAANYSVATEGTNNTIPLREEDGVRFQDLDASAQHLALRALNPLAEHVLIWNVADATPVVKIRREHGFPGSWAQTKGPPIYYYAVAQHAYGGQTPFTAIRALSPGGDVDSEIYRVPNFNQTVRPRVSPDGRNLAFAVDLDTPVYGVANSIVVVDLRTGRARRLTDGPAVVDVQWGGDGAIYFTSRNGGLQQLNRVTLDGHVEALTHDVSNRRNLTADPDAKTLAYITQDLYGQKQIRTWSVPERRERVVATIADPASHYRLGAARPVSWSTRDGVKLNGYLFLPPGFSPSRRYPVFVDVHGGGPGTPLLWFSLLSYMAQTPLEWHAWASLGYVVFVPDYRSSGEYGAAVNLRRASAPDGDDGGIAQDAKDVESGVRWLLNYGYVDPNRVVIFGHSAGGGRVNAILTQSHLFAAGIISDPVPAGANAEALRAATSDLPVHWSSKSLTDDQHVAELGGFLFDGWRSTTPTLIMVGDPAHGAVDPLSAQTLFSMLRSRDVPTRFIRYVDDGHVPSSQESALNRYKQMKAWMDAYAPADADGRVGGAVN